MTTPPPTPDDAGARRYAAAVAPARAARDAAWPAVLGLLTRCDAAAWRRGLAAGACVRLRRDGAWLEFPARRVDAGDVQSWNPWTWDRALDRLADELPDAAGEPSRATRVAMAGLATARLARACPWCARDPRHASGAACSGWVRLGAPADGGVHELAALVAWAHVLPDAVVEARRLTRARPDARAVYRVAPDAEALGVLRAMPVGGDAHWSTWQAAARLGLERGNPARTDLDDSAWRRLLVAGFGVFAAAPDEVGLLVAGGAGWTT